MRSEGKSEVAAIDEALRIGREAGLPVEIFHLKVVGQPRWGNMPQIIAKLQAARDAGQDVTADMYPYVAGGTALVSALPPWMADGGMDKLLARLRDPAIRARLKTRTGGGASRLGKPLSGQRQHKGVMLASVLNRDLKSAHRQND